MTITLYENTADPRVVNKLTSLTTIATVDAKPFFPLDILTPNFRLQYHSTFNRINYCHIPLLGRYYFITNTRLESGDAMIISCESDVLMSYRNEILNLDCVCLRTSDNAKYNKYIEDNIPSSVKATITNYTMIADSTPFEIPDSSNGIYYVLNTNGLVGD